jgi:hypothetical protein
LIEWQGYLRRAPSSVAASGESVAEAVSASLRTLCPAISPSGVNERINMTEVDRGTHMSFVSACPKCGLEQVQCYACSALTRLLQRSLPVEGYCVMCDTYWPIDARERDSITTRLIG